MKNSAAKKMNKDYFNVVTSEDGDVAEILLYGYIGQQDWWNDDNDYDITDISFIKALRKLEKNHDVINIRINSPGGSIYHGNPIISAIKNSKAEIHTFNDGMAASMASGIWLAGNVRHMAMNAVMMVHSPIGGAYGNASELRSQAEVLDIFEKTLIATFAEATNQDKETIKADYFDYKDHWMDAEACKDFVTGTIIEEDEAENVIKDVQNMSYADIVSHFQNTEKPDGKSFLQKIQDTITNALTPKKENLIPKGEISNIKNSYEMNIEELKNSIKEGDLKLEDVITEVEAMGYEVIEAAPVEPAAPAADAADAANAKAMADMKAIIDGLKAEIKALGDKPGAIPTLAASAGDAPDGEVELDELAAFNAAVEAEIIGSRKDL